METKDFKVIRMICEDLNIQINTSEKDIRNGEDIEFEYYTDTANGDFIFTVSQGKDLKEFSENLDKYFCDYDVDEEATLYVNQLGANGVPDSIETLLNDMKERCDLLDSFNDAVNFYNIGRWKKQSERTFKEIHRNEFMMILDSIYNLKTTCEVNDQKEMTNTLEREMEILRIAFK